MNLLALGTILLSVAAAGAASINNYNSFESVIKSENAQTFLTTLGPGIINENHADAKNPETRKNINPNRNVEFRGSAGSYFLMLNPANCSYMNMGFNKVLDASWDTTTKSFTGNDATRFGKTDLDSIRLYKNKTTSYTLKEVLKPGNSVVINQFGDHIVNISFAINNTFANPGELYKFEIKQGFIYPQGEGNIVYEQKENLSLINNTYGTDSQIYYATNWLVGKNMDDEEEHISIGVGSRNETNYRMHFRTNKETDNFCSFIMFFDPEVYNPEINKISGNPQYNIPIGNTYFENDFFVENLYKKVHFKKKVNGELKDVTLNDVMDKSVNPFYNLFGEEGAIGFHLKPNDGNTYDAFTSITVDAGCTFPCYGTTNGDLTKYRYFEQFTTISFNATAPDSKYRWSVHFECIFKLGDVTIKSLKAENITFPVGGSKITKPFVTIELNENIFEDIEQNTDCSLYFDQNILHSMFVNGHGLSFLNKNADTYCLMNTNGKGNTYSISVENIKDANEVTNIIVNNLSSNITMHCFDPNVKKVYGECPYYKLTDSASFTKSGTEFIKDDEIAYTVWFDGANPIKVEGQTIGGGIIIYRWDTSDKPVNPTKDHAIFDYWVDERGNKLEDGLPQINGCVDYTSQWTNLYEVKLDLGDKVVTFNDVKHGTRLSSLEAAKEYLNPSKKGYFLDKWVDENGQEYLLDNKVCSNITLKAVWVELRNGESGGCGGSILAATGVTSFVAIIGATLLVLKKKRNVE